MCSKEGQNPRRVVAAEEEEEEGDIDAVSYTHLDVYKRQLTGSALSVM